MVDIEAQMGYQQYEDFNVLSSVVTDGVYDLTSNIKKINRILPNLDSSSPPAKQRALGALTKECTERFKHLSNAVKQLTEWDSRKLDPTQKFSQQSLTQEFGQILQEFRTLQANVARKEQQLVKQHQEAVEEEIHSPNSTRHLQEATEQTPLLLLQEEEEGRHLHQRQSARPEASQSQMLDLVSQNEVDFHNSLLQEREQEISTIQQGVHEINAIFKDLGTLVVEQGAQVDTIEENVGTLAQNTQNASTELTKADNYQKSRRKWSCILLFILVIICTLVVTLLSS